MTLADTSTSADTPSGDEREGASGREFLLLVTALMATMAVGIDLMLPAFPEMRAEFGMSPDSTEVAWVVTAYFLGMAVGPWLYGPASDRYGRRVPLFAGVTLYAAAAVLAAVAPNWTMIVVARFLWGLGAGGPRALCTAMVRDRYDGDDMARLMSTMMAVFLLVPIAAPTVGAGLIAVLPWRVVFWFPAVIALGLLAWAWRRLPETLPPDRRRPFTWSAVGQAAREVVSHRQTMALTVAMMFLFATMTAYLAGSEVILEDVYDYGTWFPLFFGAVAVLLALSSLNNARLVARVGVVRLVRRMAVLGLAAAAVLVAVSFIGGGEPPFWLFTLGVAAVVPMAQGLTPNSNALAMLPLPHVAGTASSIIATITALGGSLLGGLASSAFDGTVRPYALYTFGFVAIAAACILWGTARTARHDAAAAAA